MVKDLSKQLLEKDTLETLYKRVQYDLGHLKFRGSIC